MNNKISDLNTHKQKKKVQIVIKELNTIIAVYNLFLSTLKKYGKYTLVSEVISHEQPELDGITETIRSEAYRRKIWKH
jgi:hypothetical protein